MEISLNSKREEWIDVLRGLAVFLVVLGHLYTGYSFHLIYNPIKMPSFYFIAGFVFSFNKKFIKFAVSRAKRLFIPLIVFSLFPIRLFYYLLIVRDRSLFVTYLLSFVNGSSNWFIYSFFLSSIIFYSLYKLARGNHYIWGLEIVFCFVIGIVLKDYSIMKLWSFNTALVSLLFMYFGYELKEHKWKFADRLYFVIACLILYFVLTCLSRDIYYGDTINYHLCEYYNLPLCLVLILSGFIVVRFYIIKFLSISNRFINKLIVDFGKNTIVIYLASSTFNSLILSLFRKILGTTTPAFCFCFLGAVVSCMLGYLLSVLCKKFFPFLLGIWGDDSKRNTGVLNK